MEVRPTAGHDLGGRGALRGRGRRAHARRSRASQLRAHGRRSGRKDAQGRRWRLATPAGSLCKERINPNKRGETSMSDFLVHVVPGSPFARAALVTLEEKGARYRLARVVPGTLRSAEHLRRHPFGRIPVLEHGDFRLYETQAILRYLDRVLPDPAFTPADARRAARMDQLMNVNDWYLFQGAGAVIGFQRVVGPRLLGLS